MNLNCIAQALEAEMVHVPNGWETIRIGAVFASDLMSDVLMSDGEELLLVTSLSTEQAIRSAGIVGAHAVVIANRKTVTAGMIQLAEDQGIVLMRTRFPKYESCLRIGRVMES